METKNCQNCKQDFTIEPDDFSFYEKLKVPAPTWCPKCRMIRRFNFRNERYLYRRPDFLTGKETFSGFSPQANVRTIENKTWYGNEQDSIEYGFIYDFSKPFFIQLMRLQSTALLPARSISNAINSDYCNETSEIKNSYLCFNADSIENSAYLRKASNMKECFDLYECMDDELCYEGVMLEKCYQTFFSVDCEACVDVWFSKGLRGCTNCFGCVNLKNKSHYFFNEPCTKEEYNQKINALNLSSYNATEKMKEKARSFWLTLPHKYNHSLRTLDCTGERIYDSKNVKNSYSVRGGENLRYCQDMEPTATNSYDYTVRGLGTDTMYECVTSGLQGYNIRFCFNCFENVRDLEYCIYCIGCKDCFGCVGLYKKQYCIFNTQYTKEEYESLRQKIIEHMNAMPYIDEKGRIYKYGEFFPFDFSPIAYNESMAQDFYPITKDQAEALGCIWHDQITKDFPITIKAGELPDNINDYDEQILNEVISCQKCNKAYKIISSELQFHKKLGLPLPRLCPDCRFVERFSFVNPPELWHRHCMKEGCLNEFETPYAPNQPEIIYCEQHYQQEIV